jgi:hypothetical protein
MSIMALALAHNTAFVAASTSVVVLVVVCAVSLGMP